TIRNQSRVFRRKFYPYPECMPRLMLLLILPGALAAQAADSLKSGEFHWTLGAPAVSPAKRTNDPCYSVKDPSVVYFEGRWHLFCTIRSVKRTHQIEYLS